MKFILNLLYIYIALYSLYFFALALRNSNDKPFQIEKRYSKYEKKDNLAVVIYAHNSKSTLENLINEIKKQDYPIDNFKVFVILDNCHDDSEKLFEHETPLISVLNIKDVGTIGKDQAVSILLERLSKDNTIDSYVFIDADRSIPDDFLTCVNSALVNHSVLSGETLINTENLDFIDKIKAAYQKYHMNFMRQARSLFGLAARADSGVFIIKKNIVDEIGSVDFKDINTELKYSMLLSKIKAPCTYNPNLKTYVDPERYVFKTPRLSVRLDLFKNCFTQIWSKNFVFAEHTFSLIYPNFWLIALTYILVLKFSYRYYFFAGFKTVLLTFIIMLAGFAISLVNARLNLKETGLLMLYPLYSICHIIKNFPLVRMLRNKISKIEENKPDTDKLTIDALAVHGEKELPCKLEFISESGLAKVKFIFKNKKFITSKHLRMIDALQELKMKLSDYGFILKICSCCANFSSCVDGSTNMVKGICNSSYPSPSIKEPKPTLIWNTCNEFEPAKSNSLMEEIIASSNE